MRQGKTYLYWFAVMVVLVFVGNHAGLAQQATPTPTPPAESLAFPATQEEIIQLLGTPPAQPVIRPRGGLGGNTTNPGKSLFGNSARGLAGIADDQLDENSLRDAPKVGALILFDFDSDNVKEESRRLVEQFANAFRSEQLKDALFVIAGHTDSKGSDKYNLQLSRRRAEAVKQLLITTYQISENRFMIKSYGEDKPIESNETDEGRAMNRRVEFIRIE